jgi:ubiquinone biosynthesis protein UbiJ
LSSLLKPIEKVLNSALSQDIETQTKLDQFDQRCIVVNISDLNKAIVILFNHRQLELSNNSRQTADLTITGKALTLAKLGHDPESLFSADIDINGNVQFAKQLRELLEGFEFDWEAQLARITGDTLAYPIAHTIRQAGLWLKNSHQSLQYSLAEYLKEEALLLPDKSQIKHHMNQIDTLRADFDRLEARIKRL